MTFPRLAAQSTRVRIVQLVDLCGDSWPQSSNAFFPAERTTNSRLFDSREFSELDFELVDARREAEVAKHLTGPSLENA